MHLCYGPYAYETQLVSPPVFSDSTEPSTTPFTPPPESVHLKTPSSPEVPYAEILTSINNNKVVIFNGVPIADFSARLQPNDHAMNRRVSFELTVEGVVRCLEKKSAISRDSTTASFHFSPTSSGDHKRESNHTRAGVHDEMYHDLPEKVRRSLSLRQAREFKFNNIESTDSEANMGSDWWANEKVSEITAEPEKGMSSDPVSARVS
ncbi:hypothetical protein HU200_002485 [Digitaria exilis]|uniref:Uncharacterized protein n=1 Tax=Digitaria exilis TaxID=1010633 RepID=A0A835FZF8_9POAL|nr:hypothetical protein HU200_002485 [Digitaria exilis]